MVHINGYMKYGELLNMSVEQVAQKHNIAFGTLLKALQRGT